MTTHLDQLHAQAETYQNIINEINRDGEGYFGELDIFEEKLSLVNKEITDICVKDNDGWMPF